MSLHFQSLCSSSGGNCLALWSENTRILVDCGLSSMKRTRQTLSYLFGNPAQVDSILLTHTHTDHISYYPLRVLEEFGRTIHLHDDCVDQLKEKHFKGHGFRGLTIKPFKNREFTVGEFSVKPFEVIHNPYYPTYGYQIYYQDKKIVIVTDFYEWDSVFEYFLDTDFIFVESNHDLELLSQYFNPNSRFNMPNPSTGNLLLNAVGKSKKVPATVMLGHISSQRNEYDLALGETVNVFEEGGKEIEFELLTAPLRECSDVVDLG
jgi:phosphoribosyl 1,2-cyclic phosphodiesterase